MQIIFDRGLETQNAINIAFFGENLNRVTLNASMAKKLTVEDAAVPNLGTLAKDFTTVEIVDGNIPVPVQGDYNTVLDASAAYNSRTKEYSVTVILGRKQVA